MESFLYRLDCRTKILLVLLLSLVVFIVDEVPAAALLLLCVLGIWFAAKMPLKKILSYCRMTGGLVLFLMLMQMLFGQGRDIAVIPFLGIGLKQEGFFLGLLSGCRIAALTLLLPMFALTSDPGQIALALTRFGLNYRAAFAAAAAFNLIPVFEEEARNIMDAQKLRGLRAFGKDSFIAKFRAYPALAIPLLLGAMRRSRLMGIVMDSRAFGAYKTRTWPEKKRMTVIDFGAIGVCINIAAISLAFNFMLKAVMP